MSDGYALKQGLEWFDSVMIWYVNAMPHLECDGQTTVINRVLIDCNKAHPEEKVVHFGSVRYLRGDRWELVFPHYWIYLGGDGWVADYALNLPVNFGPEAGLPVGSFIPNPKLLRYHSVHSQAKNYPWWVVRVLLELAEIGDIA